MVGDDGDSVVVVVGGGSGFEKYTGLPRSVYAPRDGFFFSMTLRLLTWRAIADELN